MWTSRRLARTAGLATFITLWSGSCSGSAIGLNAGRRPGNTAPVVNLPAWGDLGPDHRWHSGYAALSGTRQAYYVLVEHEKGEDQKGDQSSDVKSPLILFMNGGPGCSSVGGGLFGEIGPLLPTSLETDPQTGDSSTGPLRLELSPYRWSRHGHLVFADLPVGTGWSLAEDEHDYDSSDEDVADQALQFLQALVALHPWLADSPLYLAGESYAGHYIPIIATKVQEHHLQNNLGQGKLTLLQRLEGIILINPWTAPEHDEQGIADYMYHHGLISRADRDVVFGLCAEVGRHPLGGDGYMNAADKCDAECNHVQNGIQDDLDLYNLISAPCSRPEPTHISLSKHTGNVQPLHQLQRAQPIDTRSGSGQGRQDPADSSTTTRPGYTRLPSDARNSHAQLLAVRRARLARKGLHPLAEQDMLEQGNDQSQAEGDLATSKEQGGQQQEQQQQNKDLQEQREKRRLLGGAAPARRLQQQGGGLSFVDACQQDERFLYLNVPRVQEALHANTSRPGGQDRPVPGPWDSCASRTNYHDDDILGSTLPNWRKLLGLEQGKNGEHRPPPLRVLIMSGDQDSVVPLSGTRRWVEALVRGAPQYLPSPDSTAATSAGPNTAATATSNSDNTAAAVPLGTTDRRARPDGSSQGLLKLGGPEKEQAVSKVDKAHLRLLRGWRPWHLPLSAEHQNSTRSQSSGTQTEEQGVSAAGQQGNMGKGSSDSSSSSSRDGSSAGVYNKHSSRRLRWNEVDEVGGFMSNWKVVAPRQRGAASQEEEGKKETVFSLAVVRGSGHMVPSNQPARADWLVHAFLSCGRAGNAMGEWGKKQAMC